MPPIVADIARLAATRVIDITTTGRRSGRPSRIEIWWFHAEGRFIITGTPGKRDWYANLLADPSIVIHAHFKDFSGRATIVDDAQFRRRFFTRSDAGWYVTQEDLNVLVATSPMVEVHLD